MSASTTRDAEALFYEALELPPSDWAAFLDQKCGADAPFRREVEELLTAHDRAGGFLRVDAAVSPAIEEQFIRLKPEEAGERIGNYKLLQQIGEGGFGVVWMAEQERPVRRRVALKIIKLGMDTKEVIARFEQERQALAMMDHPNIAKVHDAGATPFGRPFFAMELVRGVKITEYCDEAKLSTTERLQLFIAVCNAIQHAHQKGIIHRDVKPSNILVSLHDTVAVPKVIDFGVAKATQQQRLTDLTLFTQFEQMVGTPLYMSPEQAQLSGLDIDTRSDIYSLGVLLYELLTGRTPFDPEELMRQGLDEIRRVIREEEPQKPSTFVSTMAVAARTNVALHRQTDIAKLTGQIRGDLDWIVMKALEKDRNRRYETANGLAKDIERHLADEPVQARPPSNLYRFRRFAKRHKISIAAAAAVLAALLVGLGISTWMFLKEMRARQRAVAAENAQNQERRKAENAANKSRQIAQVLTDMLEGVGPSVALGRDTKMLREILDKTAERLRNDLKDQPDVEGDLLQIVGRAYGELGEYEKAEGVLREALAIRRKLYGSEHADVAQSLGELGRVLEAQAKPGEAEMIHRDALAIQRKVFGNEHPDVARSLNHLAKSLSTQQRFPEAETVSREALAMSRKLLGNENELAAAQLNNLGDVLKLQRKLVEAETVHREALGMTRKVLGDEHPEVAMSLNRLASTLAWQGKGAEAETIYRESLAISRKLLGNEHPNVAIVLSNLGQVLAPDKLAEAEAVHREALLIARKALGEKHPHVFHYLDMLADVLTREGKLGEAEMMHREALAMRRNALGNEHSHVAIALNNLANVVSAQGKASEAELLFRESVAISRKVWRNNDPNLVQPLRNLAWMLEHQNKGPEAELMRREVVEIVRRSAGDDWPKLKLAIFELAENLFRQSKYAEAEPLYREAMEGARSRFDPEHEEVLVSVASFARLLAEWARADCTRSGNRGRDQVRNNSAVEPLQLRAAHDRAQEAERLLRDCLAVRQRGTEPTSWRTADVKSRLAAAVLAVAVTDPGLDRPSRHTRFREAELLSLEAIETFEADPKVQTKYKRDALVRLVRLYEAWDETRKVADWQQKLAAFDEASKLTAAEGRPDSPKSAE